MTDTTLYKPRNQIRIVTATSLFDGHDVSVNIMRRLLQQGGAEVIHLGHNRSVREIIEAAVQEDAQAVAVSSYQGGHMEFFSYLRTCADEAGRKDLLIFGGGGGVILPQEAEQLHALGVTRLYSPEDGRRMGLQGMISDIIQRCDHAFDAWPDELGTGPISADQPLRLARALTLLETARDRLPKTVRTQLENGRRAVTLENAGPGHVGKPPLVLGVTGPGGAGKSSLTDELIRRFRLEYPDRRYCVLSIDPSKKKTGGALLGDRIRMNAIDHPNVFMRSLATRGSGSELSAAIADSVSLARAAGFDLIIVETSGIGQGDTGILGIADVALYVMTSEFGAPMQLEKIDMLDFADVIAINKFDRRGSEDAWRDVCRQLRRTRYEGRPVEPETMPVFGTMASAWNDDGANGLYRELQAVLNRRGGADAWKPLLELNCARRTSNISPVIPQNRTNYLAEIAATVREYHQETATEALAAKQAQACETAIGLVSGEETREELRRQRDEAWGKLPPRMQSALLGWPELAANYRGDAFRYSVRGKTFEVPTHTVSLTGLKIPRVALPDTGEYATLVRFIREENVPGSFPYTAGVFPFRRADEDPKRQFAGEGGPKRTNKRFHFLTANDPAKRLSTAFDSVTLYGQDPQERPDVFGKVGESGVSIATIEDMRDLFDGFDLCDPNTSVSMTINGPAPIMLAFYMANAIEQQIRRAEALKGSSLTGEERAKVRADTLRTVRGTVQADILKEDQAQNTCIFSIDFALKMLGDIQEFFIRNEVRNYYSISISGYHIAEAGANPVSQLAFTLANGFSFVEYYLSRGMKIDEFAPNLSFFFSNGMDPEYSVIGRVARRIWAVAMRNRYHANERSQKLKYHCQTSGRSLHAQEIQFNDIRTTLQALLAVNENANSLHTNAYDEAITTPTEESVRRSMAIQLIINREYGVAKNENPTQGSYFTEWLTDEVEKAVLAEFERISSRGGVLGAMETQYQRAKIQDESMHYEMLKHTGELPIIGVNTYLNPQQDELGKSVEIQLARATQDEKSEQLARVEAFKRRNEAACAEALAQLREVVLSGGNIFEELLNTARYATLGQITSTLFTVGGQYRRSV
ncbi:MAG TPA: methylmalonyl-CoA mutase family protein [Candidatus Ozemobacteraceae bacterium]|nr:methylmalonyl-CoA mutase family protein [Candidatus Ozemobacteraceae bacterium]